MVIETLVIGAHLLNIVFAIKITNKLFSYLSLSNLLIAPVVYGSLVNEKEIYSSNESSVFLVLVMFLLNMGAFFWNITIQKNLKINFVSKVQSTQGMGWVPELSRLNLLFFFLSFIISVILFFYIHGIPLFFDNLLFQRRGIQQETFLFYKIFLVLGPFLSLLIYSTYRIYNLNFFRYLFFICGVSIVITLTLLGYKGYAVWYVLLIIMIMNVFGMKLLIPVILTMTGICMSILVTMIMYDFVVVDAIGMLIKRSTTIAAYGYNIVYYEMYPQLPSLNFQGKSLNQFVTIWKYGRFSDLAELGMGITTTIAGGLIVYLGKPLAVVAAPLIGFLMQSVYHKVYKYQLSPLLSSVFLYLGYTFIGVVVRGTVDNVWFEVVLFYLIFSSLILFIECCLRQTSIVRFRRI